MQNPFKYGQIVQADNFCQRQDLVQSLTDYIQRNQNVYVQGERRTGKSSLICETIRRLKTYRMVYIDSLEVKTINEFIKRIVTAIVSMERSSGGVLERVFKNIAHLRPVASVDPISGLPVLSFDSSVQLTPDSIPSVLDMIESINSKRHPLVVVFDEFQDIINIRDFKEALAILRSKIQFHSDIPYIFAGSVRKDMDGIFNDPDSPFFKSSLPLYVGELNRAEFERFLAEKFSAGKRVITPDLLNHAQEMCFGVPGDIQQLCGALWEISRRGDQITQEDLPRALEQVFAHESKGYETLLSIVSAQQFQVLTSLAKVGGEAPTSKAFLKASGVAQASSVKVALNRLMARKIIFFFEGQYRFVNPFFRAWLLSKNL